MNIVIPLVKSDNECEDLKYSLRSIEKNLIVDYSIIIIGYKPEWIKNVKHIPFVDGGDRYGNVLNKIIIASLLYDEFVLFHDDMFIIKPLEIDELKTVYKLQDFKYIKKWGNKPFQKMLRIVYNMLIDKKLSTINYTTHTPFFYESNKVFRVIEYFNLQCKKFVSFETLYYNYIGMQKAKNVKKVKFGKYDNSVFNKEDVIGKTFLSCDEFGKKSGIFEYIKDVFKTKSKYEK